MTVELNVGHDMEGRTGVCRPGRGQIHTVRKVRLWAEGLGVTAGLVPGCRGPGKGGEQAQFGEKVMGSVLANLIWGVAFNAF